MGHEDSRDPVIDAWLRGSRFGADGPHLIPDQLTALRFVATDAEPDGCPDEVLTAWHRAIARQRRVADQSEPAFIDQARRQGWSWQRIAAVLDLPDAEAAAQRSDELAAELSRTHPRTNPDPWELSTDLPSPRES